MSTILVVLLLFVGVPVLIGQVIYVMANDDASPKKTKGYRRTKVRISANRQMMPPLA